MKIEDIKAGMRVRFLLDFGYTYSPGSREWLQEGDIVELTGDVVYQMSEHSEYNKMPYAVYRSGKGLTSSGWKRDKKLHTFPECSLLLIEDIERA